MKLVSICCLLDRKSDCAACRFMFRAGLCMFRFMFRLGSIHGFVVSCLKLQFNDLECVHRLVRFKTNISSFGIS